jgi:hypothetical protein
VYDIDGCLGQLYGAENNDDAQTEYEESVEKSPTLNDLASITECVCETDGSVERFSSPLESNSPFRVAQVYSLQIDAIRVGLRNCA